MEETGVPAENPDVPQVTDKLYKLILVYSGWSRLLTSVVCNPYLATINIRHDIIDTCV